MTTSDGPKMTARELLVDVAGEDHAEHTVTRREPAKGGTIKFWCGDCNLVCEVAATPENAASLANVPLVSS